MKITYDAEADAMYIYLQGKPGQVVNHTQELGDGIAVDYASADGIYGIEILDASERLGFASGCPEVSLEQLVYKGARSLDLAREAAGSEVLDVDRRIEDGKPSLP